MITTSTRRANKEHKCDFCNRPISAGERYTRLVAFPDIWRLSRIVTAKAHLYDYDPEGYFERDCFGEN